MASRASCRFWFGGVLACALACTSATALAQQSDPTEQELAEAERLFRQGVRLSRQERWAEALEYFRQSREIAERPSIVYNIATVLARLGRARDALAAIEDFLRIADPRQDARMKAEALRLRETLRESFGMLRLEVTPPDVEVRIDGELAPGSGSPRQILLDPGRHGVSVSAPGHSTSRFSVSALAGTHVQRSVELSTESAQLAIVSSVDDALIVVDGAEVGRGSANLGVDPGSHVVEVRADGHEPFERTVEVEPGERFSIDATLDSSDDSMWSSPIFWTVVGVVVVGAAVGTGVAIANSGGEDIYEGTAGFTLHALTVE